MVPLLSTERQLIDLALASIRGGLDGKGPLHVDTASLPPELQEQRGVFVTVLVDLVVTMDQLTWNVWKSVAPNSIVRRDAGDAGDLKKLAGPYLVGDNEISTFHATLPSVSMSIRRSGTPANCRPSPSGLR